MNLQELFDDLSPARIAAFVQDGQEESLLLDFKTVESAELKSSEDRRNLAKAISGFANSSGGLIVWGVTAKRKSPDSPDVAIATKEIGDLPLFLSRLNEYCGQFVRPLVDGVISRAIPTEGVRGFAVTLVPESTAGPHMALGGEGRYFKRSGSAFYPMEHFDIEDMFGRRRKPKLVPQVTVRARGVVTSGDSITFPNGAAVHLFNEGRGTATHLFVRLSINPPFVLSSSGPEAEAVAD